jgi:hypothetical protein
LHVWEFLYIIGASKKLKVMCLYSTTGKKYAERDIVCYKALGYKNGVYYTPCWFKIVKDAVLSGRRLLRGGLFRKKETIDDITTRFPYWFCKKYSSYANNENSLPFDQHMLIALQAPRYCYIASASEDLWADPSGELLAAKLASNYYKIYNLNGLIVPEKIELDVSYNDGHIAYHRRTGNHGLSHFDWEQYMTYFEKISK